MTEPLDAEIVVAVHDVARPVRRAVESVLACPSVGVVVVAHGVNPSDLDLPDSDRVRIIELCDALGKPGAAFNAGIAAAKAPWIGLLGSDDWFAAGAIQAMLLRLRRTGADAAIAPLSGPNSARNTLKPVTWRRRALRADRDRLFYRTAPLGLFARDTLQRPRYRFAEDAVAGVDQLTGARLWTDGLDVVYWPTDPPYVVGDDAPERVTLAPRSVALQGDMWRRVWDDPEIRSWPGGLRRALGEKILRVHVFDWLKRHPKEEDWHRGDLEWLSELIREIELVAPGSVAALSRAQQGVLNAVRRQDFSGVRSAMQRVERERFPLPSSWVGFTSPTAWPRPQIAAALSRLRSGLSTLLRHSLRQRRAPAASGPSESK